MAHNFNSHQVVCIVRVGVYSLALHLSYEIIEDPLEIALITNKISITRMC